MLAHPSGAGAGRSSSFPAGPWEADFVTHRVRRCAPSAGRTGAYEGAALSVVGEGRAAAEGRGRGRGRGRDGFAGTQVGNAVALVVGPEDWSRT
ncbi:hypothetical protein SAMN05192584_1096 [Streptomyces pini]|uniref:Uncharacterized protein n=1 Tax=Streptomyces pini TaxID=1520580 RepID=A0A1I4CIS5_9ACTN|nr:hypothetical protein SAMN05192584_1096 [Streptomyces pini]